MPEPMFTRLLAFNDLVGSLMGADGSTCKEGGAELVDENDLDIGVACDVDLAES